MKRRKGVERGVVNVDYMCALGFESAECCEEESDVGFVEAIAAFGAPKGRGAVDGADLVVDDEERCVRVVCHGVIVWIW